MTALAASELGRYFELREDGTLIWRRREGSSRGALCFNGRFAGKVAGSRKNPERHIDIKITFEDGTTFSAKAHRIVMAMVDGAWPDPDLDVDHKDGNPHNNRRANLRSCNRTQNAQNMKLMARSSTGLKGVRYHSRDKVWHARIRVAGRPIHLGSFRSDVEAARAYDLAAITHHGDFARTNAAMGLI